MEPNCQEEKEIKKHELESRLFWFSGFSQMEASRRGRWSRRRTNDGEIERLADQYSYLTKLTVATWNLLPSRSRPNSRRLLTCAPPSSTYVTFEMFIWDKILLSFLPSFFLSFLPSFLFRWAVSRQRRARWLCHDKGRDTEGQQQVGCYGTLLY